MALTAEQFGKTVVASGLMTADELKALWAELPAAERPKDGETFSSLLIKRERINKFQADELLSGHKTPLVLGDYVLLAKIGAGGMGQVYKAQHRRMERIVALKVMSSAAMKDEAAVKRFQREVRAAARLEHSNIVTAYDSGEAGNVKYLVMQFVDGGDLSDLVKNNGPLPIEKAVDYVLQAARGLAFAHAEGVIHRDIKPANLLLDKKGVVKILDMGLARIESSDDGLTATEQVMGTVDYMSPEQAANTKGADGRADIYSLGCTLWYLLTGKKAYEADTMIARLMAHREAPLPSLVKTRDDAPWALEQALHKMLAKRPQDRFQSMEEVIAALEPFGGPGANKGPMGSSIGMGSQTNAELANFLKSVGPNTLGSSATAGARSIAVQQQTVTSPVDATAAFTSPDAGTDPKSEMLTSAAARPSATKPKAVGSKGNKPPIKLIAGGILGMVALLIAGIIVSIRDKDGNVVAELNVPEGASVEVRPTVAPTPSAASPMAGPANNPFALEFDGTTQTFIDPLEINFGKPITIEGYFRPLNSAADNSGRPLLGFIRFFSIGRHPTTHQPVLAVGHHQNLSFPYFQIIAKESPPSNRDAHYAAVWAPPQVRFYIDGKLVGSRDVAVQPSVPRRTAAVICERVHARIDEVRISQTARYTDDFRPSARFEPDADTLCLYHCDEGKSALLVDASASKLHIPFVGGKWVSGEARAAQQIVAPKSNASVPTDYALKFDGGQAAVTIPNLRRDDAGPCTLECWVRNVSDGTMPVVRVNGRAPIQLHFHQRRPHGAERNEADKVGRDAAATAISPENWTHIAYVVSAGESRLFVDGKSANVQAKAVPGLMTKAKYGDAWIGSERFDPSVTSTPLTGEVDELRVSKVARYTAPGFTPVRRHEPDADTLALYHFDEGSGDVLHDSSGQGHDGKILGAKWVQVGGAASTDAPRNALQLNGVGYVDLGSDWNYDGGDLTFEAWLISDTPRSMNTLLAVDHDAGGRRHAVRLSRRGDLRIIEAARPSEQLILRFDDTLPNGRPTHFAAVWQGSEIRIYIDGKRLTPRPHQFPFAPRPGAPYAWLGAMPTNESRAYAQQSCEATLLETRITSRARYDDDFTPPAQLTADADTVSHFKCDEGAGDLLHDSSGRGRQARIAGPKWVRVEGVPIAAPTKTDLLKDLDVVANAVAGRFALDREGLRVTDGVQQARIILPVDPLPAEYDLHVAVGRTAPGGKAFVIGVPWQGSQGCVVVDGFSNPPLSGLELIDGQTPKVNGTENPGEKITFGPRNHKVIVRVRNEGIAAECDGKPLFDWKGQPAQLSTHAMWAVPRLDLPFLGFQGPYVVHGVELFPFVAKTAVPAVAPPKAKPTGSAPPLAKAPFDAKQAKAHQAAWAQHLGTTVEKAVDLPGGEKMTFVLIPPGEFLMGSSDNDRALFLKKGANLKLAPTLIPFEGPQHSVQLSTAFYLSATEVTQSQWQAVMGTTPWKSNPDHRDDSANAAGCINWEDATKFCSLASKSGHRLRLPTEAEWEYSCRAGTTTAYSFGDWGVAPGEPAGIRDHAWFYQNTRTLGNKHAHRVGQKLANGWGLFDMHGNVWEWCSDWYGDDYYARSPGVDPAGPSSGSLRVSRGGAWGYEADFARSGFRYGQPPDAQKAAGVGFRAVLTIEAAKSSTARGTPPDKDTATLLANSPTSTKRRFASDEWIDVIPLVAPSLDKWDIPKLTGKNEWLVENGELFVGRGDDKAAKLLFPLDLNGPSFECEVEFTRLSGTHGFNLDIPVAAGPCPMVYDRDTDGRALLGHRGLPLAGKVAIKTGERGTIRLQVRHVNGHDEVETWFNGMSLGKWTGSREDITSVKNEGYPHDRRNGLWMYGDKYVFHRIRYRMLDGGSAETLRTVATTAATSTAPGKLFMHDPAFPQWMKDVRSLPAQQQLEAVSKKLVELNPGFDGKLLGGNGLFKNEDAPRMENGVVKHLRLNTDAVTDISPIRALTGLQSFTYYGTSHSSKSKFNDLSQLQGMPLLKIVNIGDTEVSDLTPLRGMALESLLLIGNREIADLTQLKNTTSLKLLWVGYQNISTLAPLKSLPLTSLNIRRTNVSDLSPLAGMTSPAFLNMMETPIADLSPLAG